MVRRALDLRPTVALQATSVPRELHCGVRLAPINMYISLRAHRRRPLMRSPYSKQLRDITSLLPLLMCSVDAPPRPHRLALMSAPDHRLVRCGREGEIVDRRDGGG